MKGLILLFVSICVVATLARPNLKKRERILRDIVTKNELNRQKRQITRGNLVKEEPESTNQNDFFPTSEAVASPPETEIKPTSDPSSHPTTDIPFHLPQDFNGQPLHAVEKSPSKNSPFGRVPGPMGGMPGGMQRPMGGMPGPMGGMPGAMGGMPGPMGGMPGPMGGMPGPMGGMPGPMGGMPRAMRGMPGAMGGMPVVMGGMPGPMGGMPGPMGGMPGSMRGMPGPMGGMPGPMGGMPGPMGGMPGPMPRPMGGMPGAMGGMSGAMSGMPGAMGGMSMPSDFQGPSGAWVDQSKLMGQQQRGDMGKVQEAQKKFMEKMIAIKTGTNGTANMTDEEKKQFLMSDGMPPMTPMQSAVGHEAEMVQNMIEYEKQLAEAQHTVLKQFYTDVLTSRVVNTMFRKRLGEELQTLKSLNKEVERARKSMAGMPQQQLRVVPQTMMGAVPQGIMMDPRAAMMGQMNPGAAMMGQMDPRAAMMGQMNPGAAMMGQMDPRAAMMGSMDPRAAMMGQMNPRAAMMGQMDPRAAMMGQMDSRSAMMGHMDPRSAMMSNRSPMVDPRAAMQMQQRQMMMARRQSMMTGGNTGSRFVGRLRQTMQKKK